MFTSSDIRGVFRGACRECECMEYIRKVSNDTAAAAAESFILCIYCGHLPTKHVSVFEKKVEDTSNAAFMVSPMPQFVDCSTPTSIASSSTIAAGSDLECDLYTSDLLDISNNSPASSVISKIKTASASVSAGIDFPDAASNRMSMPSLITVQNEQESLYIQQSKSSNCEKPLLNVHEDDENSFPLPKFSKTIQPLLLGTVATNQEQKELSYQMKTELVHHIRVNNLLKVPTSEKQDVYNKKMYRLLGSTLTKKYPHMLWDTPSTRSKKTKNTQIWSTFVHHVSMRLKQRRNREKKTKLRLETLSETTEVAEEENLSVEDAQKELKLLSSMFSQTVDHTSLYSRLRVLLQKTATERVECSQLPSYFLVQEGLSIELEIRSKNEISKVEDAVDTCINKYFQTERNGEKTVKDLENDVKGSRCIYNFICSTDKELSQKTPGPKVIFCPEKEIKKIVCSSDEEVILEKDCSMTRASLLCLVVYYIKNLTYPAAFAPILVILQKIVFPQDKFGTNLMSQKVKDTLKMMNLH